MRKAPVVKMAPNVVATVDGTSITRDDVLGMFEMVHGRSVVNQLIQIKALQAEAKRQNVTVTPDEINAAVKKIKDDVVKRQYDSGQGPMEFGEIAKEQGFTPTYIEWNAYLDTLRTKTFEKSISNQIPPLAGQIKVAHILLATIPLDKQGTDVKPTSAADQEAKDAAAKTKIETILADIKAGRITFENAAKQYSDDKSNSGEGGELPYAAKGTFDPGFEAAAFSIPKVGDVVGPIKSQFGWHLIKLIAIGKDAPPAEQAAYRAQEIAQVMKNPQSMQYWFNQVVQKAKISINPDPILVPSPKSPLTGLNLPGPAENLRQVSSYPAGRRRHQPSSPWLRGNATKSGAFCFSSGQSAIRACIRRRNTLRSNRNHPYNKWLP